MAKHNNHQHHYHYHHYHYYHYNNIYNIDQCNNRRAHATASLGALRPVQRRRVQTRGYERKCLDFNTIQLICNSIALCRSVDSGVHCQLYSCRRVLDQSPRMSALSKRQAIFTIQSVALICSYIRLVKGTASDSIGASGCEQCRNGTVAPDTGSLLCNTVCPPGTTNNDLWTQCVPWYDNAWLFCARF
jgi:hypothetical protein